MTLHTVRVRRTARGARAGRMTRVMASLEQADFRRLAWLARQRKVPVAAVLRDAVWAYLLPIAADADRATSGGGNA